MIRTAPAEPEQGEQDVKEDVNSGVPMCACGKALYEWDSCGDEPMLCNSCSEEQRGDRTVKGVVLPVATAAFFNSITQDLFRISQIREEVELLRESRCVLLDPELVDDELCAIDESLDTLQEHLQMHRDMVFKITADPDDTTDLMKLKINEHDKYFMSDEGV